MTAYKLLGVDEMTHYPNPTYNYFIPPAQENETALEFDARLFAASEHRFQKRKYTYEPYVHHPAAVTALVRTVPHTPEMLAAAWLHDMVEDCGVTLKRVEEEFGPEVSDLVEMLTDVSMNCKANRATRKAMDLEHLAIASPAGKTIKLADIIDNSSSILAHDKNFAKVYLREKRRLLAVLQEGAPVLWAEADRICREAGY